jgi:hypothetical protein
MHSTHVPGVAPLQFPQSMRTSSHLHNLLHRTKCAPQAATKAALQQGNTNDYRHPHRLGRGRRVHQRRRAQPGDLLIA